VTDDYFMFKIPVILILTDSLFSRYQFFLFHLLVV